MIEPHKQFNLPENNPIPQGDFISSGNMARTDKDLNVKNRYIFNDKESYLGAGQKFKRTSIDTLVTGSVYSVITSQFLLAVTSLSYAPNIGLPLPKLVGEGKHFIVKDEAGGAASTTITITSAGEKTIDGASSKTITSNYGSVELYTDGANWFTK